MTTNQKARSVSRNAKERSSKIGSELATHEAFEFMNAVSPWATTLGRILLGLVLAWFGYHELIVPGLWTGYIPFISPTSNIAQILVLAHGVFLSILAIGLIFGILPRVLAALAALAMLEIIATLIITAGLSDLVLRDIGVFGLTLSVLASRHEKLMITQ